MRRIFGEEIAVAEEETLDRLAVYGSLAPGRSNHHHLASISGTWGSGWVEGILRDRGWGAAAGYPGIRLQTGGPRVDVSVLESHELNRDWGRLDAFEGDEYRRVQVEIHGLDAASVVGFIYELRP